MIDTHSHILPGLDDGSPDVAHSLRMAEAAVSAGVTKIVCTPHMREFDLGLAGRAREVLQDFRSELSARAIELTLVLGFEVDICVATALPSDQLRLVTIEGSEMTLLLEMPHWGWPTHVRDTLFRLRSDGITPMLAHPERNDRIQRSPDLLEECIDSGAIVQATAASIDGTFGHAAKSAFFRHLSLGHVSILATDAHANRHSSWTAAQALATIGRALSPEDADLLVRVNPERALRGERPLPVMGEELPLWRKLTGRR